MSRKSTVCEERPHVRDFRSCLLTCCPLSQLTPLIKKHTLSTLLEYVSYNTKLALSKELQSKPKPSPDRQLSSEVVRSLRRALIEDWPTRATSLLSFHRLVFESAG